MEFNRLVALIFLLSAGCQGFHVNRNIVPFQTDSFRDNIATINGVEFEVYDTLSSNYDVHSQHEAEKDQVENPAERIIDERKQEMNHRPIIGILAQELSSSLEPWYGDNYTSYIGAAYVKYVEQAGARVVPVLINQDDDYYDTIFKSTNGLLIPGGAVSIVDSGYAKAGKILFQKATASGSYWPIWGTCLGFELLAYLSNEEQRNLKSCSSQQQPLALELTDDYSASYFASQTPDDVTEILATQNVTINFHRWCLTPENFTKFEALKNFWNVLSTNRDWDGLEFISLMEAKHYPIWGSQYHPEKNAYEWTRKYPDIPHFKDAIHASAHQAEFFIEQTRKNLNSFASRDEEEKYLIYSYQPEFTGDIEIDYSMQQCYLF